MGRRGPKPQATVIAIAKGDPGRRANKHMAVEPKPPAGRLEAPNWLSEGAKGEWARVCDVLAEMEAGGQRLLTKLDLAVLTAYCVACADLQDAVEHLEATGAIITTGKGYQMPSPWVAIKNRSISAIIKLAAEFGFSPSSRSRVSLLGEGDSDALEEALNE